MLTKYEQKIVDEAVARTTAEIEAKQADLRASLAAAEERADHLQFQLERKGYRRCDNPACNCNGYHGGLGSAEARLVEIYEALGGCNGTTPVPEIERISADLKKAEALAAERRDQINKQREQIDAEIQARKQAETERDEARGILASTADAVNSILRDENPLTTEDAGQGYDTSFAIRDAIKAYAGRMSGQRVEVSALRSRVAVLSKALGEIGNDAITFQEVHGAIGCFRSFHVTQDIARAALAAAPASTEGEEGGTPNALP